MKGSQYLILLLAMLIPLGIFAFVPYVLYEPLKVDGENRGGYINEFGSDRYSVKLKEGKTYTIIVTTDSDLYLILYISDSPYMLKGRTTGAKRYNHGYVIIEMVYTAEKTDTFYIHVDGDPAARGSYKIKVSREGGTAHRVRDFVNPNYIIIMFTTSTIIFIIIAVILHNFNKIGRELFSINGTYKEKEKIPDSKAKKVYLNEKLNEIEDLIEEKQISKAHSELDIILQESKRYHFKKITINAQEKMSFCIKVELEEWHSNVDKLIEEKQISKARSELEKIILTAKEYIKKYSEGNRQLRDAQRKIILCDKVEEQINKINTIKKTIIDLGMKFTRLQISDISERTEIKDENLIIESILAMIKHNEIYAEYFQGSKSVVFNQQANIDEIDKLMETYKEWEDGKVEKKE